MLERQFDLKVENVYSDNGGEFLALRPYLSKHGIGHFNTAP